MAKDVTYLKVRLNELATELADTRIELEKVKLERDELLASIKEIDALVWNARVRTSDE